MSEEPTVTSQDVEITPRGTAPAASGGCSCCGPATGTEASTEASTEARASARYLVEGMTCGHCVSAVTSELSALDGVSGVEVDLVAGGTSTVTVTSAAPLGTDAVAAAIDEAGYRLVQS